MTWMEEIESTINDLYAYYPETGILVYERAPNRKPFLLGKGVGTLRSDGYLVTKICQKNLLLHRVIWFFVTGTWTEEIDHDNRIRCDNRWVNLLESNRWNNSQNIPMKPNHSSGVIGVCAYPGGKWQAYIQRTWLGYFDTKDEAILARKKAEASNGSL